MVEEVEEEQNRSLTTAQIHRWHVVKGSHRCRSFHDIDRNDGPSRSRLENAWQKAVSM